MIAKEHTMTWKQKIKFTVFAALLMVIGFVIGAYITAPSFAKEQAGYIPAVVSQMPVVVIEITNLDGTTALIPVRMASDAASRKAGLREVGSSALDDVLLLYVHTRGVSRFNYEMKDIRSPLDLVLFNAQGEGIAIEQATLESNLIRVTAPHRWALAGKTELLSQLGITNGSFLKTDL